MLTKLLMPCFMCRDPNHATAEVPRGPKPITWKPNIVPVKHLYLIINKKTVKKALGSIFGQRIPARFHIDLRFKVIEYCQHEHLQKQEFLQPAANTARQLQRYTLGALQPPHTCPQS